MGEDYKFDTEKWIPPPPSKVSVDPDVSNTFEQIVAENGFKSESHKVTTTDNYELKMFRVNNGNPTKPPVFLQHGLFSDSATWILNKEKSPCFRLAALGYDVWLGNNRGNVYSRANTKINPDKDPKDFFNYSFFTLGAHDAPT